MLLYFIVTLIHQSETLTPKTMTTTATDAQKIFGKQFDNQPIITKCIYPAGLTDDQRKKHFIDYRRALRGQQKLIKRVLH